MCPWLTIGLQLAAGTRINRTLLLVIMPATWDGTQPGRFDGVDCWHDTPCSSGSDSRALQPHRYAVAKALMVWYR
jgi:hypothetical protein